MNSTKIGILVSLLVGLISCQKTTTQPQPSMPDPTLVTSFYKGADVSWITQQEAGGVRFYQPDGTASDIFAILKSKGVNSIRLRVWVNPQGGWNGADDVLAKAKRANAAGMKLLIDFHHSDSWADPGQQTKPSAWQKLTFAELKKALFDHTVDVMNRLKTNGITPDWVQVGNETNNGMLWPDGQASTNMANFAALVTTGYEAVKSVSPTSQVLVHLSNGYDKALFQWLFNGLTSNSAKFDMIGMSLYPTATDWAARNEQCLNNISTLVTQYKRPVMVVEVGMPANDPATANAFITDLITKLKTVPNGNGMGVFYWEPQAYKKWQGYGLGAFDDSGKPTAALDAFLK
ncbi:glycoside hydrolase family 53 protein [Fibrella forsythiae]|uniref:Arabinogalactan endo-beta-1,4-galactanase n=1 Tax=Fibrella forsythiae TaxID=2817061 RepID=A0ABS3JP28_9BACT|nr:glycosyl hydrolase 53 family protein [Fibrella forsythiae]MBO0951761.1 glycosyl hydrolase 53 family protein [Fibrella forsythiae]